MAKGYSLHIGLNQVDDKHYQSLVADLDFCENDAIFYADLAKKMGFEKRGGKVNLLCGKEATVENVEKILKDYANDLVEGDMFFLSYSGHGGQIKDEVDDQGKRDERDNLDETWCLYDRQYLDDEIHDLLFKFEEGVRILVISDSCHSGTITRGEGVDLSALGPQKVMRGGQQPMYKMRYIPKSAVNYIYQLNQAEYDKIRKHAANLQKGILPTFKIEISACKDKEKALEFRDEEHGELTAAIKRVLTKKKSFANYEDFFDQIVENIRSMPSGNYEIKVQNPQMELRGNKKYDFRNEVPFSIS